MEKCTLEMREYDTKTHMQWFNQDIFKSIQTYSIYSSNI